LYRAERPSGGKRLSCPAVKLKNQPKSIKLENNQPKSIKLESACGVDVQLLELKTGITSLVKHITELESRLTRRLTILEYILEPVCALTELK
jgi:hypothetical protein